MDGEATIDPEAARGVSDRGRLDHGRVGIIDVGSNSIRLVVYERASRAALPVFNEKVLCGLARGLDATGRLNPQGVELALVNIDRFTTLAHNMKVTSLEDVRESLKKMQYPIEVPEDVRVPAERALRRMFEVVD